MKKNLFVFFLFLAINSWCRCVSDYGETTSNYATLINCNSSYEFRCGNATYKGVGSGYCVFGECRGGAFNTIIYYQCDTECEAKEIECNSEGGVWDSANCKCLGDDGCSELRSECESMGGRFTGTVVSDNGQTCCRSSCNVCGGDAMKNLYNAKSKICCDNGQAPPDSNQTCQTVAMPTSGCGMVISSYGDFTSGGWQCGDPSTSFEASQRYRDQCFGGSSSSGPNSSGGGSSGGGSSGGNQDCQECPYLEAILDTLTRQKLRVDDIYDCLTRPGFCGEQQQKDSLFFPDWVETKMDKIIQFDSTNVQVTKSVDSVLKRVLVTDSAILDSDSLTRLAILHGVDSLVNAIKNSSGGDSLGEYIDRIANLLGVQTSTLSHHLDSILNHIPNDILDSIYKYQKTSLDFFDSSFYVFGEGFGKIDNLTDSAIKYFRQGFYFDSVYSAVYRDSLGEIHEAINSLSTSIGYALGYGDTATSTLRQDLFSISEEIQRRIGSFDSSVSAGNDSLLRLLSPGAIDSGSVGYGSGFVAEGERFGDSLARAVGWLGGLDGVNHDSIFRAAGFDSIAVDSVGRAVDDSLNLIADSLNNILVAQNDSIKNNLSSTLDAYSDSLIAYSPFASFDSLIFGQLGAKIPNSNQCPDDCNKWSISLPRFGLFNFTIDYGLCLGRVPLGGMNVLGFIRLLLRIVVVWSCIWIVFNALTRRKD